MMLHFALVKGIPCLIADLTLANIWGRFLPGAKIRTDEYTEKWSLLPDPLPQSSCVGNISTQTSSTKENSLQYKIFCGKETRK